MRTFNSGATRDSDTNKPDYEGFLSPLVLLEFGKYMSAHRVQADGKLRDSDNWQKGIPRDAYMKSLFRHFFDLWMLHRGHTPIDPKTGKPVTFEEALSAIFFNNQGYFHEYLKDRQHAADTQRRFMSANDVSVSKDRVMVDLALAGSPFNEDANPRVSER
jgi:hypothetical protein